MLLGSSCFASSIETFSDENINSKESVASLNQSLQSLQAIKFDKGTAKNDIFRVHLASFTADGATGTQSITGLGFKPRLVLIHISEGSATNFDFMLGFGTSFSQVSHAVKGDNTGDSVGTNNDPSIIKRVDLAGAVTDDALLASLDSDGFTLNWVNASSSVFWYLAVQ